MPGGVYSVDIAMIELGADQRIALTVDFVSGKNLNMGPQFAAVHYVLAFLDLDIFLPGLDFRPFDVGAGETLVQVGTDGFVLQLARYFEWRAIGFRIGVDPQQLRQ